MAVISKASIQTLRMISLVFSTLKWMPDGKSILVQVIWLSNVRQQAIVWAKVDPHLCHCMLSLGHNVLNYGMLVKAVPAISHQVVQQSQQLLISWRIAGVIYTLYSNRDVYTGESCYNIYFSPENTQNTSHSLPNSLSVLLVKGFSLIRDISSL